MKLWCRVIVTLYLILTITACSSNQSSQRAKIVQWAEKIMSLEKRLNHEADLFTSVLNNTKSLPLKQYWIATNIQVGKSSAELYEEMLSISPPDEVLDIHQDYLNSYESFQNAVRYHSLYLASFDITYYEKEGNYLIDAIKYKNYANNGIEKILDKYNISCKEIDYCEPLKEK